MSTPFRKLQGVLCARFPERRDVIAGALAAALAGEHVLLLGPPDTAKSALPRAIAHQARHSRDLRRDDRGHPDRQAFRDPPCPAVGGPAGGAPATADHLTEDSH